MVLDPKQIHKYQTPEGHSIIKSNTYAHSVAYIHQLVAIAKGDFPDLKDGDISIKVYNDDRWGRQTAIEFQAPLHPDYQELLQLPDTFN